MFSTIDFGGSFSLSNTSLLAYQKPSFGSPSKMRKSSLMSLKISLIALPGTRDPSNFSIRLAGGTHFIFLELPVLMNYDIHLDHNGKEKRRVAYKEVTGHELLFFLFTISFIQHGANGEVHPLDTG